MNAIDVFPWVAKDKPHLPNHVRVVIDGQTYVAVTDGTALVARRSDDVPVTEDTAGIVATSERLLHPRQRTPRSIDLASLREFATRHGVQYGGQPTCSKCDGEDGWDCPECEGTGEHECDCGHVHRCGDCDGSGMKDCTACNGQPHTHRPKAAQVKVMGIGMDASLLRAVLSTTDASTATAYLAGELDHVLLVSGDWRAVIMPMRMDHMFDAPTWPEKQ